jgi:hypothetical protein
MNHQLSQERGKDMSQLSEEQLDQVVAVERSRAQEPLNEWRTIAARAREEGLIREEIGQRWSGQPWMQAAAAVLLLVGGIAIGRTTLGLPSANQSQATAGNSVAANPVSSSAPRSAATGFSFASVDEATQALDRAVNEYNTASQFLASNNISVKTRDSVAIYTARAAALDKIVNATESALRTAPEDPVINQYYLATMGARAATQQLVARPVALRGF